MLKVTVTGGISYEKNNELFPNLRGEHVGLHFHVESGDIVATGLKISETKVLRSAAGYYIGHEYEDTDFGDAIWMPYDRISGYYATRAQAEIDLQHYRKALGH